MDDDRDCGALESTSSRFSFLLACVHSNSVDGVEDEEMRTQFIADDGTAFDSKEECQRYERENAMSDYEKEWGEHIPLKERAHKVRAYWKVQLGEGLSDDYLASVNKTTRLDSPTYITGEVNYMRDDAVEILLKYIEQLERESNEIGK